MNRDKFFQTQHRPDQWAPVVRQRELEMVQTGTWFFGLFNRYVLRYTDWEYRARGEK